MSVVSSSAKSEHNYVRAFVRLLLRPIIRIVLRHGMTYREMSELCKQGFVEAASIEFGSEDQLANVSQVAMVTGMTRRDVRRLREEMNNDDNSTTERLNNATRVLFGWYEDRDFLDAMGKPNELPLEGPMSFETLSKRYVGDIRPSTMLKELKRVNSVEITKERKVRALSRSYRPGQASVSDPELIFRAGTVLRDVGTTVRHNLSRETDVPSRFERRATNIRMSPDVIPAFHRYISREAQKFLERVDRWLSKHELLETRLSKHKTIRLGFGGYWIQGDGREKSGVSE